MTGATRPSDVLREAARYLDAHGVESSVPTAEALLMHVLRTDRAGLYARRHGLSNGEARALSRALCQRCTGVPLQYIIGEQQFMDLLIATEPGVFVPRPETEGLVEAGLEVLAGSKAPVVVDVGTGTGAVALAIKAACPAARVLATDVSPAAVMLARKNAGRHGLEVEVLQGSLLDPVPVEVQGQVALLVSNPPYVSREDYETLPGEVKAEPYEALVGGTHVHTALAEQAPEWLAPGGWIVVEIASDQGSEVRAIFEAHLERVEVLPDLVGRDRLIRARRPETGPDGKSERSPVRRR